MYKEASEHGYTSPVNFFTGWRTDCDCNLPPPAHAQTETAGKSWFQFNWTESWIFAFIANISILISLWLASAPPLNPCADVMSWSVKYNWPGHFATLLPRSHHHPRPPNDDDYKIGLIEVFLLFLLLHVCHLFAGSRWLRIMLLHNSLNTISTINNISSSQQHPVNDRM